MLMIRFVAPAGNHPEYGSRWRIFFRRSSTRGSNVFCDFALPERFLFLLIFPPDTVDVHMVAGGDIPRCVEPSRVRGTWSRNRDHRVEKRGRTGSRARPLSR